MNTKIRDYYDLHPVQFDLVNKLVIQTVNDAGVFESWLEIELMAKPEDSKSLNLQFQGIRSLVIDQPAWSLFQIELLEPLSLESDQLEGINYKVKNSDGTISFVCRDFSCYIDKA